ncbi:hydroxyacylglutathione hydrolase [Methylophilus aquaticus]|uniref:Hydroxyacylglutathione hydrolase n=1 Tax=Methylophilus aquaticus TaxID=1971610 RepID=A0ABT9JRE8_9PROT|nr:hydroxyacylglutathione hydrolase [Methylophilus aquaticus]MDP8567132.1 hydroxyacylglutathione hydrolase [Methylophilus aquaticus]
MSETTTSLHINALPAFSDNYLWLLRQEQYALVVDPGDADVVEQALHQHHCRLVAILLTHHHADHTGGAAELQKRWQCPVYAPDHLHAAYTALHPISVHEGEHITFPLIPGLQCRVMCLPGHTLDHVAYLVDGKHLFSGDVIFGAGCGRLFEGTPVQMYQSLQRIAELPESTLLYPAHEYTAHNIAFALTIEPDNEMLKQRAASTLVLRDQALSTLPSTVGLEKNTNPFLRCAQLVNLAPFNHLTPIALFTALRARRNSF